MFTGKDTASEQEIEPRVCVAPRYENAFTRFAEFVVPKYRNSVRGVFAVDAKDVRKHFGSDVLKTDQTNSRDGLSFVKFRSESRRKTILDYFRINSIVNENASSDDSFNDWQPQGMKLL
jgi:hypothetical protein